MNPVLSLMLAAIVGLSSPTNRSEVPATAVDLGPISARQGMIVSGSWLEEHLGEGLIVVEVGTDRRDFRAAHIRGARFLDWSTIAVENRSGISLPDIRDLESSFARLGVGNEGRIVLYSRDLREATWAWFALDSLGHGDRAAVLDGGWSKWLGEGRPIAGGDFVPGRVAFEARPVREVLIDLDELRDELRRPEEGIPFVIDARAVEEYRGEVRGRAVDRVGHIPGATSVSWTRNLEVVGGAPVFKRPESLRMLYLRERAATDPSPIVYCRTGLDASMTYFVLRFLGFEPRLYGGSYIEWSAAGELPVGRSASVHADIGR